jgi:hypothetical protein
MNSEETCAFLTSTPIDLYRIQPLFNQHKNGQYLSNRRLLDNRIISLFPGRKKITIPRTFSH